MSVHRHGRSLLARHQVAPSSAIESAEPLGDNKAFCRLGRFRLHGAIATGFNRAATMSRGFFKFRGCVVRLVERAWGAQQGSHEVREHSGLTRALPILGISLHRRPPRPPCVGPAWAMLDHLGLITFADDRSTGNRRSRQCADRFDRRDQGATRRCCQPHALPARARRSRRHLDRQSTVRFESLAARIRTPRRNDRGRRVVPRSGET